MQMAASGGFLSLRGALRQGARRCRYALAQEEATARASTARSRNHPFGRPA